jgi:hypothetical protein
VPDGQKPLDLEGDQRLAERGSAHAELGGQFTLGRQPVAGNHLVVGDVRAQLFDDDLIQTRPHHGTQLVNHWATYSPFQSSFSKDIPRPLHNGNHNWGLTVSDLTVKIG